MDVTLYERILDHLYEGVYFVDQTRKILYWNTAAERLTGYKAEEIIGKHCYANILNHVDASGKHLCINGCPLHQTLTDGEQREALVYLHHKDGHRVQVMVKTIPMRENGEIVGAIEVFIDESKQVETFKMIEDLKRLAMKDTLTELPNRRWAEMFLANQMQNFVAINQEFGIMMIDIDDFKLVNDIYGHDTGDKALKVIAKTMQNAFRRSDTVARWGGEEFIAILPGISKEKLSAVAETVRMLVEHSFLREIDKKDKTTISIGATIVKQGDTIDKLIKRADMGLYKSKQNGKNCVTVL